MTDASLTRPDLDPEPKMDAEDALLAFPVIGIGASAGGLEAAKEMMAAAPRGCGMAFVLVQHLDPDHESLMTELISRATDLTVRQIRDGDSLEPDHLFVIPPGRALEVSNGVLHLRAFESPRGLRRPIDDFFASLARSQGPNAACVILSGTGSDGTAGLRIIKERGGVAAAQDPETARYDGMPTAALGTGLVDFELDPAKLVDRLSSYFSRRDTRKNGEETRVVAANVDELCEILREGVGHDFSNYKLPTMVRRIERRMKILDFETVEDYIAAVRADPEECEALFRDLLIHVTAFFRDAEYFDQLSEKAIVPLVEDGPSEIRVWIAGCSTGEEAYSIAMLFAEAVRNARRKPVVQIFATDISEDMLKIAREGRYPSVTLLDIPERFRETYTIGLHGQFQIAPRIRDMVRFSSHSVIKDPPFSRIDLLSCRNLMIYMGDRIQKSLIPLMHYALKPGGFLFLGPSESLSHRDDLFSPLDQKARLFRRNEGGVSYPFDLPAGGSKRSARPMRKSMPMHEDYPVQQRGSLFSRVLLDRYAPASVLLSGEGEILASHGELAKFFKLSIATPDRHVSQIARDGVRETLLPLMREALAVGKRRARRDLEVSSGLGSQTIDLIVDPLSDGTCMAIFVEVEAFRQQLDSDYIEATDGDTRVADLEEELRLVRFRLRGTVEELETANEELKSSNEEMMSMNEELQSANEELSTVNEELKNKVDEIGNVNTDLKNFLGSAKLALISVDADLRIRTFTDEALAILPLKETDRGRPLTDVNVLVQGIDLVHEAHRVLRGADPVEATARSGDGQVYLARILPYRLADGSVAGVTMTFADITKLSELQRDLEEKSARLELALSFGKMGVWEYDPDREMAELDDIESDLLGFPRGEPVQLDKVFERVHPDDRDRIAQALARSQQDEELYDERFRIRHPDGSEHLLRGIGRLHQSGRMVGLNFDITDEAKAQADKELLFREMNHRVKNLFAVVASIVTQTARSAETKEQLAEVLRMRILALSKAHAFTLDREGDADPILLRDLLDVILNDEIGAGRIALDGGDVTLTADMVTPIGLILHELATNSFKYGALSRDAGQVTLGWKKVGPDGALRLVWTERGGPPVVEPAPGRSFGTRLIDGSVAQLGGIVKRDWKPDGLRISLSFAEELTSADSPVNLDQT